MTPVTWKTAFAMVLVNFFVSGSAIADGAKEIDWLRIEKCLSKQKGSSNECLRAASDPCAAEQEHAPNPLKAQMWCDLRELDVWGQIRSATYEKLLVGLRPKAKASLQREEKAWRAYEALACNFPFEHLQGTWVSHGAAACLLEKEHQRAVEIRRYFGRLQAGEFNEK